MFSICTHNRRFARSTFTLLALAAAVSGSACSSLPTAGPRASQINDEYQPDANTHPFALVEVTANTIEALKHRPDATLASQFGNVPPVPELIIGRGDGLTVSIWEHGSEPLFSGGAAAASTNALAQMSSGGSARSTTIPEQIVGGDGCISIPFVGRLPVAGRTAVEVQQAIEQALAAKTEKPQVLVTLSHNSSNTVTILGEVTSGARMPLSTHGERLLEILASAGGAHAPTYETQVQLTRGDVSATVPLLRVLRDPKENIFLQPGDDVIVTRQPETYTAFGATGHNAQINFDAAQINLTEAVAKAGGLQDSRADPRGVFLFRFEPRSVAAEVADSVPEVKEDAEIPVVYRLDFTKAGSYFLAQDFTIRNHDVLYISNAPATELQKFLNLIGTITQPAIEGAVVQNSLK